MVLEPAWGQVIGGVAAIARQCACHRLFMRPLESCLDMRPTPVQARARRCRLRLAAVAGPMVTTLAITAAGCASANGAPTPNEVDAAIRARTAEAGIRIERAGASAAGRRPDRRRDAGGSRGDRALEQPVVSGDARPTSASPAPISSRPDCCAIRSCRCSFRWGPNSSSSRCSIPFEALLQRPARVAAARLNAKAIGERLVWDALTLVAQVRRRTPTRSPPIAGWRWPRRTPTLARRLADITDARLRAGDISELEARAPRSDASRTDVVRRVGEHERDLARLTLAALLGLDPGRPLQPQPVGRLRRGVVPVDDGTLQGGARIAARRPRGGARHRSAAARARWEHSRVLTLIGILDANGRGTEGFEMGPGVNARAADLQSQSGRDRARRRPRSSAQAGATRPRARRSLPTCGRPACASTQAQDALDAWTSDIVPSLEIEQRQAESAYQAGEIPLFTVLDVSRRLVDGRMRQLDAEADLFRTRIALDRADRTLLPLRALMRIHDATVFIVAGAAPGSPISACLARAPRPRQGGGSRARRGAEAGGRADDGEAVS